MSLYQSRVLVLGASGETGQQVLLALANKGLAARAMVRSKEKAQQMTTTQDVFVGEITAENMRRVLEGVTAIISTLGTRSLDNLNIIRESEYTALLMTIQAAQEAGIAQIVLCSSMGTHMPESIPPLTNVLRAKQKAEEALQQSGLVYTIVHPGGLRNDAGGKDIQLAPHPLMARGSITREDVAEVLVQALLQSEARNASVDIIEQPGLGPADRTGLFRFN